MNADVGEVRAKELQLWTEREQKNDLLLPPTNIYNDPDFLAKLPTDGSYSWSF